MPTGNFNCGPNVCVCACQSGGCICRDTLLGERDASEKWSPWKGVISGISFRCAFMILFIEKSDAIKVELPPPPLPPFQCWWISSEIDFVWFCSPQTHSQHWNGGNGGERNYVNREPEIARRKWNPTYYSLPWTPFLRNSLLKWYSPRVDVVFYSLSVLSDLLCKVFGGSWARARHSHPLRLRGSVHITISSVCVHFLPNAPQWCMKIKIKKHCLRYVEHMCIQGYLTGSKAILEFHKLTIHSFWPVSLLFFQNKQKTLPPQES